MNEIDINALSEKCKQDKKLFNILIVLLSSCNQDCIHCYIPEHKSYGLPLDTVKKCIDEARELGALNVTLTGGEIFVRKDIYDIIEYAKIKGMRVFLMSNASLLTTADVKKLYELGIAEFSTTLFSMDPEIHDAITLCPGSFNKTMSAIMDMKNYGIPVTIKTPLMEINKYAYKNVEKFAEENKFNFMSTTTIFSKSDGDTSPHDLGIQSDLCTIVRETRKLQEKYRDEAITFEKEGIPCGAGFNSISVNYDGTIWPCNSLFLNCGNVFTDSLVDVWHNSEILNEWRKKAIEPVVPCQTCNLKNKCLRCPGMALLEDNDLYGCSSSAKKIAELM
jgi:radical SAM protein with 4Fe4S-binding SPASM domain